MTDEPRNPKRLEELEVLCLEVGDLLDRAVKQTNAGFCLMLFDFGDGGWMTYTSNAVRGDMIAALAELEQALAQGKDKPSGSTHTGEPPINPS